MKGLLQIGIPWMRIYLAHCLITCMELGFVELSSAYPACMLLRIYSKQCIIYQKAVPHENTLLQFQVTSWSVLKVVGLHALCTALASQSYLIFSPLHHCCFIDSLMPWSRPLVPFQANWDLPAQNCEAVSPLALTPLTNT